MTKRILQIIPSLDRAGAEKQMCLLASGLPTEEFDVHVCALTRGGPLADNLREAGIETTVIGKRTRLDPRAYWQLRQHIGRLEPDLVHTWLFAANAYGRKAAMARGVRRIIAGERCVDPWKNWTELAIDRYLARRTDRILTNSSAVKEFYVARGLPETKFVVIPNAVIPIAQPTADRDEILDELDLPPNTRLIGLIARLWRQKGVKHAIWATDLLKQIRDDVHLLILGDGPLRSQLTRYRDLVEIADRVHFLGHRDDAARLLPHFDVLFSTSDYEGQSNAILEAMVTGVPVVATDIPGTRDLITQNETGFLVPPGKAGRQFLAKHANNLLDDRSLSDRIAQAARHRMLTDFTLEKMIDRHVDIYRELLD